MALNLRKGIWHVRKIVAGVPLNRSTKTGNRRLAEQLEAKWTAEVVQEVVMKGKTPINLHKVIDEFVSSRSHLVSANNCRQKLAKYKTIADKPFHKVSDKESAEVIEGLFASGSAKSTTAITVAYWNSLINYAEGKGYSVPKKLARIKGVRGKIRFLTLQEEVALLNTLDPTAKYPGKNAPRDAMRQHNKDFICLLIDTGARYHEIVDMEWNQVDFVRNTITIHRQKGGTDTILSMTDRVLAIMKRRHAAKTDNKVIIRPKNEVKWWDRCVAEAKLSLIPSKVTMHTMRHTFAVRVLKGGVGLHELQHLLGHVDIGSTLVYAHFVQADATHKAAGILNRLQAPQIAPAAAVLPVPATQALRLVV